MTVGELLERCSSAELTEWHAYFLLRNEETEREMAKARARRG